MLIKQVFNFLQFLLLITSSLLSSFEKASTPGQTQTGLVYSTALTKCDSDIFKLNQVLSSKTIRPRSPCDARCIEHAFRTWSVICPDAPRSQFSEGARPHLCMDKWN